jgi:RNA polymerase sigma-70 factor (ECF subfamily)
VIAFNLTSVVFLEAWRRRDVALEADSALPWLYGVAVNVLRNANRSLRRHRQALARVPVPPDEPDPADDVAGRLDDERRMRDVLRVVGRLPRHEREVLQLCAWDRLSYEDAAATLGVPVGTIRSRLSRARRRLGELADDTGHELNDQRALARAALTGLEGTR